MGFKLFCVVFTFSYIGYAVDSASILALFSSLSYADHLVYAGYLSRLVQGGHTIVIMTPYPGHYQFPDTEHIIIIDVSKNSEPYRDQYTKLMTSNTDDYHHKQNDMYELMIQIAIAQIKSLATVLINPDIVFHLVITEADMPLLYAVAERYKGSHIAITTTSGRIHQYESKGNPIHPILYPDVNSQSYRNLGLWEKISEIFRHIQTRNDYYNNYLIRCQTIAGPFLGPFLGLKRSLLEVEYDIDLLFVASSPLLIGNRPSVPAVVYVDRMHITPGLSLPQEWLTILDSSTRGAVYFSLGVMQGAEQLPTSVLQTLADVFGELPYTVLWKTDNTTKINKPDNVYTNSWFPQQQVLAHRNVKAFITHGGARSLEEAVFYAVPIVGLPLVKSRRIFINEITRHGAGEILDPHNFDKETVKTTINVVVTNEKYKKSMTRLKEAVVDPHVSGPEKAIWWTEYLLRNGNARHLRSPAVGISFIQYYFLDIVFIVLMIVLLSLYLALMIERALVRGWRSGFWRRRGLGCPGKFKAL